MTTLRPIYPLVVPHSGPNPDAVGTGKPVGQ